MHYAAKSTGGTSVGSSRNVVGGRTVASSFPSTSMRSTVTQSSGSSVSTGAARTSTAPLSYSSGRTNVSTVSSSYPSTASATSSYLGTSLQSGYVSTSAAQGTSSSFQQGMASGATTRSVTNQYQNGSGGFQTVSTSSNYTSSVYQPSASVSTGSVTYSSLGTSQLGTVQLCTGQVGTVQPLGSTQPASAQFAAADLGTQFLSGNVVTGDLGTQILGATQYLGGNLGSADLSTQLMGPTRSWNTDEPAAQIVGGPIGAADLGTQMLGTGEFDQYNVIAEGGRLGGQPLKFQASPPAEEPTRQSSVPTAPAAAATSQPQTQAPSLAGNVEYFSNSKNLWIRGNLQAFNEEFGTYTLDVQPFAKPGYVRYAPQAVVEYYSASKGTWVPSQVMNFNEEFGTYTLTVKQFAQPQDVRLAGFSEPLQAPVTGLGGVQVSQIPELRYATERPRSSTGDADASDDQEDDPVLDEKVRALTDSDKLPVGAKVEYFSQGKWLPARIRGFNAEVGTYELNIRPYALAGHIRIPGRVESQPPSPEKKEQGSPRKEGEEEEKPDGEANDSSPSKPMRAVPQYNVQKQREGTKTTFAVFISASDGSEVRAFDGDVTSYELNCEADSMKEWLEGLSSDLLPGLLTLLQYEVQDRHERLKVMNEEKDSYKGQDHLEYFGLSEESTEKDIDRAYRKISRELHPDKGGDEAEFAEMRRRYEQLKENLDGGEKKNVKVEQGDPLAWDPADRQSMLTAHDRMRSFLVWVTNDLQAAAKDLTELRRRHTEAESQRRTLLDEGAEVILDEKSSVGLSSENGSSAGQAHVRR